MRKIIIGLYIVILLQGCSKISSEQTEQTVQTVQTEQTFEGLWARPGNYQNSEEGLFYLIIQKIDSDNYLIIIFCLDTPVFNMRGIAQKENEKLVFYNIVDDKFEFSVSSDQRGKNQVINMISYIDGFPEAIFQNFVPIDKKELELVWRYDPSIGAEIESRSGN